MICWQSRGFHNAQSTTRTTCSSPGDAGKDEPARTRCHEGTKPNPKEKTVAMKLSPHKTDPRGGQRNPTAQQLLHPTPRFQHRCVKELQLLLCMSDLLPNHNCCTPPRAGWGWQRDASRPQGPPGQALSPRLARGRGTSSVPCSLEQA